MALTEKFRVKNAKLILMIVVLLELISEDINEYLLKQNGFSTRIGLFNLAYSVPLPRELKIGGLFEKGEENLEVAFRLALDRINTDTRLLPTTRLVPVVEKLDKSDSFAASRKVCRILQNNLIAIFGPQSSKSSNYARSICSTLQMPHFEMRWDSSLPEPMPYSINMAPLPSALGKALRDLVVKKNWKTFAILYSEDSSMILIQEILKHTKMHSKHIIVRKAREAVPSYPIMGSKAAQQRASPRGQSRTSFKEILKELSKLNVKNMVIDVPKEQVLTVLVHAHEVNMLRVYNSYIFTTLDLHTVDLRQFYHTGTNISAFSIMDSKQFQLHEDILGQWDQASQILRGNYNRDEPFPETFQTTVWVKPLSSQLMAAVELQSARILPLKPHQSLMVLNC